MAGLAVQSARTRAGGALALGVLFMPYAGLWLRRVIGFPGTIGTWSGFAEELALVTAVLLAYEQYAGRGRSWAIWMAQMCRVLFALSFVSLALALASGVMGELGARLLTAMSAVFGITIWLSALVASPRNHFDWCANAQNLALLGAARVVADWFTAEGRWRTS